jgi:hypothetical protein
MRVDFEFPNHLLAAICGMSITLHQKVIDCVPLSLPRWYLEFTPRDDRQDGKRHSCQWRRICARGGDND